MEKVGIFFGSSTGNTEAVAELIQKLLGGADLYNVADTSADKLAEYSNIILGTSTWGVGDLQDDMEGFVGKIAKQNLSGKVVAIYGLGDSSSYGDTFCDGIGTLYEAVKAAGATVVGFVPTKGYTFDGSKAQEGDNFVGLPLDADNESGKTEGRVDAWLDAIKGQFK